MQSEYHARIEDINFSYKKCDDRKLKVNFEFKYPVKLADNLVLAIRLEKFNLTRDNNIQQINLPLSEIESFETKKFSAEFDLDESYDWKNAHNAYIQLLNADGTPLSEEAKVYIQRKEGFLEPI